jgi:predicted  nucleic acid-binding Zn-ribbon protein
MKRIAMTDLAAALISTTQALISANARISVLETTLSKAETAQALVAANKRISALEAALLAAERVLAQEGNRADALNKELRIVNHKHEAYLRHFGSCPQHPDT